MTDQGQRPSLAIAPGDVPLIASVDPVTRALELARWSGSAWTSEEIDRSAQVGHEPSLALDSADRPAVSYFHNSSGSSPAELRFARWDGAAWSIDVIAGEARGHLSLAFDSGGLPAKPRMLRARLRA